MYREGDQGCRGGGWGSGLHAGGENRLSSQSVHLEKGQPTWGQLLPQTSAAFLGSQSTEEFQGAGRLT